MDPLHYSWVVSSLHIKEEGSEAVQTLLSPPATPSSFTFSSSSPGLPPRGLRPNPPSPKTSGRVRPRPYPPTKPTLKKDPESISQPLQGMQWHTASMRSSSRSISAADSRPSTDGERQATYDSMNGAFMMPAAPGSSLMGAIAETSDGQYSRVPSLYPTSTMGWNEVPMMAGNAADTYPGVPGHSALYPLSNSEYVNLDARNSPPEPHTPPYYQTGSDSSYVAVGPHRAPSTPSSGSQSPYSREDPENELRRLRRQVKDLERALATAPSGASGSMNAAPAFRSGWKRRTEARRKLFCSLNRAGNALCAWHDSRRERRQYPPRNAPAGMLNCGCTHEEALFEESLSRHGVGGYLPGENVRMDPELRRPLLRLLQERYGYRDGDFDYNPQLMEWYPEQDPESWERQAHSGTNARTRRPDHVDRH